MIDRLIGELSNLGIEVTRDEKNRRRLASVRLGELEQGGFINTALLGGGSGFDLLIEHMSIGSSELRVVLEEGVCIWTLDRRTGEWLSVPSNRKDRYSIVSENQAVLPPTDARRWDPKEISANCRHEAIFRVVEELGRKSNDFWVRVDVEGSAETAKASGSLEKIELQGVPLTPQKPQPQE